MNLRILLVTAVTTITLNSFSQTDQEVKDLIFHKDSLFWVAYNSCDTTMMSSFLSDDVEFYHDKGGITNTRDSLMLSIKNNLCANNGFRLRREAVPGTVKVFPLKKNDVPYGAIISGEHLFYINQTGKKEFLDGHASFSQLWILKNGSWKMTRILSYDHHPAKQNADIKEIKVSNEVLDKLAGRYKSEKYLMDVSNDNGTLLITVEGQKFPLKAASDTEYFMTERDLKFIFTKNKLTVKERGEVVEEGVKQ